MEPPIDCRIVVADVKRCRESAPQPDDLSADKKKATIWRAHEEEEAGEVRAEGGRSPLDLLCKLFPNMKRSSLQTVLDRCDGDVTQTIDQLLSGNTTTSCAGLPAPTPAYLSQPGPGAAAKPGFGLPLGAGLRYPTYSASALRGLPFGFPYPAAMFSSLPALQGYSAMAAAISSPLKSAFPYPPPAFLSQPSQGGKGLSSNTP